MLQRAARGASCICIYVHLAQLGRLAPSHTLRHKLTSPMQSSCGGQEEQGRRDKSMPQQVAEPKSLSRGANATCCPSLPHHPSSEAPDLLSQFCLELLAAGRGGCARTQHAQQDQAQDAFNGQVTLVGQESLWVELAPRAEHIPEVAHAIHHAFREGLQVCISQLGLYRAGRNEMLR